MKKLRLELMQKTQLLESANAELKVRIRLNQTSIHPTVTLTRES